MVKSKSPSAVTVALRLPPSETVLGIPQNRVSAKVRSDTPLWKLLRHLEEADGVKQKGLNLTARGVPRTSHAGAAGIGGGSGQLYWETPVLKFAGREFATLDDFRKTLSQVGIDTGSQLIMLEFRVSSTTLQEAMEAVHSQLEKADTEAAADKKAVAEASVPAPTLAPQQAPAADSQTTVAAEATPTGLQKVVPTPAAPEPQPAPEPMEVDTTPQTFSLRPVQVWSPPKSSSGMPAAASLPWAKGTDSSYAPSIAQMKAHQKHLEEAGRNKRLKSDSELEEETREREAKAAAVSKVDVRIRFPDGYTVMWSFANGATGANLHAAVRSALASSLQDRPFRLTLPMSRDDIQDSADAKHDLVRGYGMRGGVVVNFLRSADVPAPPAGQPYLAPDVRAMAREIVIPQAVADDDEDEKRPSAATGSAAGQDGKRATKGDGVNKMAKFLRLSKK